MTSYVKGGNLIGGEWQFPDGKEIFYDLNPATSDVVAVFPEASTADIEAAVEAARRAFRQWCEMPAPQRGRVIFRAAEILESNKEELAKLITIEEGKTLNESFAEVNRVIDIFRFFGGEGWRFCGETIPSETTNSLILTIREPLGVVGIITPWNFPLAIPAWKLCPALIAGNTVVFKPSSLTPLTAMKLVSALVDAGLPTGVLNFLTGKGSTTGQYLIENQNIDAVTFTGSFEIGARIYIKSCTNLTRAQVEVGGKNAVIILEDADLDRAVEIVVRGAFSLSGQACTATSRVIVVKQVFNKFAEKLIHRASQLRVGNGLESGVDMGPVASEEQVNRVHHYIKIGQEEGADLLLGAVSDNGIKNREKGFFVKPCLFVNVKHEMRIAQDEIFGPVLCVLKAHDFDEAIDIANSVKYGLVGAICTNNMSKTFEFARRSRTGIVKINMPTIGLAPHAPFGGFKRSSLGGFREQGKLAVDFFTAWKTIYLTWNGY